MNWLIKFMYVKNITVNFMINMVFEKYFRERRKIIYVDFEQYIQERRNSSYINPKLRVGSVEILMLTKNK